MRLCVCVMCDFQLMMSSTPQEDGQEVALETVKSVTLTQDKDGSIILHCPTNGGLTHTNTHTHVCALSLSVNLNLFIINDV